jgi:hypothetical protein
MAIEKISNAVEGTKLIDLGALWNAEVRGPQAEFTAGKGTKIGGLFSLRCTLQVESWADDVTALTNGAPLSGGIFSVAKADDGPFDFTYKACSGSRRVTSSYA